MGDTASAREATLAAKREDYARRLRAAAQTARDRLSALPEVHKVSLFGSFARGRADLFTDLDVLVVLDTDEPMLERLRRLYGLLALPVDLDLLCYTPTEVERLRGQPFLEQVLRDEVVVYEKKRA